VAFVGRLEPHKEPHVFIESIRLARESGADVFADVIGDGYLRPELEQRVITAGLADRIRFHGWLTDPNRLMAQASLIAMTSRHEGASLVVLEAGALGKGVVAREGLEGLRHDWPGAIYRVAAHAGATEFAAAFADLAARPDAIVALGSAARSAYEGGFTLQQSAREWAAMYRRAVG
jgi:glycosyltransferase involved in cell wall biosynthesis